MCQLLVPDVRIYFCLAKIVYLVGEVNKIEGFALQSGDFFGASEVL